MRRFTLLTAILALAVAPSAMAKMTTVKGAKCTVCHEGAPKDKKFNAATQKMFPKYKEAQCKDCHGWADGKFTTIKKK
ncbi:MAG TPA: cytochrome c3 family protein [Geothrix sp.]|nr:cytochrome c3 family protein [Geothrix sp.]